MAKQPTLWGPGELIADLGVSRMTLSRWRKRADFPKPQELSIGPVWFAADVKAWNRQSHKGHSGSAKRGTK